jgi:hypothetical protein
MMLGNLTHKYDVFFKKIAGSIQRIVLSLVLDSVATEEH